MKKAAKVSPIRRTSIREGVISIAPACLLSGGSPTAFSTSVFCKTGVGGGVMYACPRCMDADERAVILRRKKRKLKIVVIQENGQVEGEETSDSTRYARFCPGCKSHYLILEGEATPYDPVEGGPPQLQFQIGI